MVNAFQNNYGNNQLKNYKSYFNIYFQLNIILKEVTLVYRFLFLLLKNVI